MARKRKITSGLAAAVVIAPGLSLLTAAPANAAEVPFGAFSCSQGTILTSGRTALTPTHFLTQGGQTCSKTFANSGSLYKTNNWCSGKYAPPGGGVQNPGSISSAYQNCDA